jgi:hypothetical protein
MNQTAHIARLIRVESRGFHAIVTSTTPNPEYGRYAEARAEIVRRGYEQMGVELALLADTADEDALQDAS